MRPSQLTVKNWMRYRGEHTLELGADIYGVVARLDTNEERSNWLGKTSLLYTIPFALFGKHPKDSEDGWITDGEGHGFVELTLTTGIVIKRERRRKRSTQLIVTTHDGKTKTKKEAQTYIEEQLQLTERDFFNTCFFEQKAMHRFVTCTATDRMKIVAGWLNLGPLQRCESNVSARLSKLVDEREGKDNRIEQLTALGAGHIERLKDAGLPAPSREQIDAWLPTLRAKATEAAKEVTELRKELAKDAQWREASSAKVRYDQVVAQGKLLRAEADAENVSELGTKLTKLKTDHQSAVTAASKVDDEMEKLRDLLDSGFDGTCPVTCGECPVAEQVNNDVASGGHRLEALQKQSVDVHQNKRGVGKALVDAEQRVIAVRDRNTRLDVLRTQALQLRKESKAAEQAGDPPDTEELEQRIEEAQEATNQWEIVCGQAESMVDDLKSWDEEMQTLGDEVKQLEQRIGVHREAMMLFGRNGAQRLTAEDALDDIETDANAGLEEAGIDLALAVTWAHEASSGLAVTCEFCGAPFPKSQKAKVCAHCGATRGKKMIEKLELQLSDESGAADDLVGIHFQLAASAWLRQDRGSPWAAAMIDEPFGALDTANKKSLVRHFANMLRTRYRFEQSLVVAHDMGIMDALPGRIEIDATETHSTL